MTALAGVALLGVAIVLIAAGVHTTAGWTSGWLITGGWTSLAVACLLFAHHCDTREEGTRCKTD